MKLQVGVKALLKNQHNKYLLIKRNPKKYSEVGAKWDIVGGRINPGTSLIENLAREIKEEVGLELKDNPKLIAAQDIFVSSKKLHIVRLTYTANIEGEPKLDQSENTEFKWFSLSEIKKLGQLLDSYFAKLVKVNLIQ